MKNKSVFSLAAVASILSLRNYAASMHDFVIPKCKDRYYLRAKQGGGRGGAGVITRHGWRTKQPEGYYAQQTPLEHMHSRARRLAMANVKVPVKTL